MTPGTQELWWESPDGTWYWRASDGHWYPGDSHPRRGAAVVDEPPATTDPWEAARQLDDGDVVDVEEPLPSEDDEDPAHRQQRRRKIFVASLAAVTLAGFVLRICYVYFAQPGVPLGRSAGDALYYDVQGLGLRFGFGYTNPQIYLQGLASRHYITPDAQYQPITSMVLAGLDHIGIDTYFMHQIAWCLIGTLTLIVIALTAREIAGDAVGLIAGAVAALYPGLWINDGMVESETLLELWVAVLIFLCYRYWRRRSTWLAAAMGATSALITLTRPEGILFLPLLVLPTILLTTGPTRQHFSKGNLILAGTAGVCFALVMAPWTIRNITVFDHPQFTPTDGGQALMGANNDFTYYGSNLGGWQINAILSTPMPLGDQSDQDVALRHTALTYAKKNAGRLPVVIAARVIRAWGFNPTTDLGADVIEGRQRWASTWGLAMLYLMIPPAILTFAELRWLRLPLLPLLIPIIIVTLTAITVYGDERFRADAEPALVLAATITSITWSDLPTLFRNLRSGLHPRFILGMQGGTSGEAEGGAEPTSMRDAPTSGDPPSNGFAQWTGLSDQPALTSVEILPGRPGHEPSFVHRRVSGIALAVLAAGGLFIASMSVIDLTGAADRVPRSGSHQALLLMDEQLTNQVTRIQYEKPGHFDLNAGAGTQYVRTGEPSLVYAVTTKNYWSCAPFASVSTQITISWSGTSKPLVRTLNGLEPLAFHPTAPISCF